MRNYSSLIKNSSESLYEKWHLPIVGTGEQTSLECGTVRYVQRCKKDGFLKIYTNHCDNSLCSVCYHSYIKQAVNRIFPRLDAVYNNIYLDTDTKKVKGIYKNLVKLSNYNYSHWVVSFDIENIHWQKPYDVLKYFKHNLYGVAIYHPYRLTQETKNKIRELRKTDKAVGGDWEIWHKYEMYYKSAETYIFSPHLHIITVGYIPHDLEYDLIHKDLVIKKIRNIRPSLTGSRSESLISVLSYLLTHAGVPGLGAAAYKYIKPSYVHIVTYEAYSPVEPVYCPVCGAQLMQYDILPDGSEELAGYAYTQRKIIECSIHLRDVWGDLRKRVCSDSYQKVLAMRRAFQAACVADARKAARHQQLPGFLQ